MPDPKAQYNFTDPESRIMKAGDGQHFEQAYNAQAAVNEQMLIVGERLSIAPNDKEEGSCRRWPPLVRWWRGKSKRC